MLPVFFNVLQDYDFTAFLPNNDSLSMLNRVVAEAYDSSLPKSALNSWEDKNVSKIYTDSFLEQQDTIDRWIDLNLKFNYSFKQKEHLFSSISSNVIENDFNKSLMSVLLFFPETINVGVSDDECVYIHFEKNNKSVYFDLFFEPDQKTEASITIFENNDSKLSFTGYLDNSINKIKDEFITKYELSCPAFA
ncbi:MAG: hypothetical protein LBE79_08325 [Tannerella sp.]|jgi:hypothetical protein|nr:hypothetical protein [Tannerella sp.]